jgi:hypothetical protein
MVTRYVFPNWTNYNKRVTILHSVQVRLYLYLEKEFYNNLQLVRTKKNTHELRRKITIYVINKSAQLHIRAASLPLKGVGAGGATFFLPLSPPCFPADSLTTINDDLTVLLDYFPHDVRPWSGGRYRSIAPPWMRPTPGIAGSTPVPLISSS